MSSFIKKLPIVLAITAAAGFMGCGGSGGGAATTYSISGTLDPSASLLSSLSAEKWDPIVSLLGEVSTLARTQCSDGFYYGVYCVSFSTPPVAAEGNVNCGAGGGGFTVAGMPIGQPVGCFIRRYTDAVTTAAATVGSIEIPAANLSGSTDTLVSSGDVALSVSIDSSGTITAAVTSGTVNDTTNTDAVSAFTSANINGEWSLSCTSNAGGDSFSSGLCKCFLGEDSYAGAGYNNQDDCLNDPNGAAAAIAGNIEFGVGLYVYTATANSEIVIDSSHSIPSGSTINALSIWATSGSPGSYVSLKGSGGEGVTDLGGKLTWDATGLPETAVNWTDNTSGTITVVDGNAANVTFTMPAAITFNTATHAQFMAWIVSVVANADGAGFLCSWGPNDSVSHMAVGTGALAENIHCMNQVIEAVSRDDVGAVAPRIWIQPFCDQGGCIISEAAGDGAQPYFSANALIMSRLESDDGNFAYPNAWANTDDNSAVIQSADSIGIGPSLRFMFEPLEFFPGGAGVRQGYNDERHYECTNGGTPPDNTACSNGGNFYELVCHQREELAIKFIGTTAPFDVVFDSTNSVAYGALIEYSGNGRAEITPSGTTATAMCEAAAQGGSGTFFAKAVKQ